MNFNLLLSEDFNKYAANVTISGIVIVFAMLVLLVLVIFVFGKIMSSTRDKAPKIKAKPAENKPVENKPAVTQTVAQTGNDDEIIAVISAAVASLYLGTGKTAVVRSIKPAKTAGRSAWSMAGLNQNVRSF